MRWLASLFCVLLWGGVSDAGTLVPRIIVLQYHHVSAKTPAVTSVTPEQLQAHLTILREEGFEVWSLPRVLAQLKSGRQPKKPVATLTFDDAYQNFLTHAWPILSQKGLPAAVFVPTSHIGDEPGLYLSWPQIRQLSRQGVFFASHSHTHAHLAHALRDKGPKWVKDDVMRSMALLTKHTGQESSIIAYPYGEYSLALKRLVRENGWIAFGQHSGPLPWQPDWQALPRFPLNRYVSLASLREKLRTLPMPVDDQFWSSESFVSERMPELKFHVRTSLRVQCYASGVGAIPTKIFMTSNGMEVLAKTTRPLVGPRFRFNCTAPANNGLYYWISHPFVLQSPPVD